ncbi:citrate synthase [Allofrancisella guangzhouensis]|uniref:Citrate synthase n=1 Tax=Allofrancisella guangzhouensis TaxID=594679 RepID=A0A0A8E2T8_9GAMM|nr:citrate synthase [Allofrancisella guangzhouensis]AJC48318.1 type II citrate synthase [Allofrancisella guangzhouensis]MBK2026596.1 citrate synthase [Allofrancisella guangzhouensis]MBK2044340.1 citrate synthase [Allofrancisella guangzhouensis]MBK2045583.1 citrate synthase [Allofrancisella guangzhouensis]
MSKYATLKYAEKNIEIDLPVYSPSLGNDCIDVSSLVKHGLFTYDPGFMSTASCESKITYIDGEKGVLLHRGYPIQEWTQKSNYRSLCYALIYGQLPTDEQRETFRREIITKMPVCEHVKAAVSAMPKYTHPMSSLIAGVNAIAAEHVHNGQKEPQEEVAKNIIAKIATITAMAYRHNQGKKFLEPNPEYGYAENFLYMMFAEEQSYKPDELHVEAMDTIFILHADHEQNASTSTVRLSGSTGNSPYAAIIAGITALWGPAHGGANEAVLKMLSEIGNMANINKFIEKAKDKDDPFRLMGFGHRVYKNTDPRATAMKQNCEQILAKLGNGNDPLLAVAKKLEEIALQDEFFIERKLFPNVDFYSGIILKAMGIPEEMFTAVFALARTSGWISQWIEMVNDPAQKIGRPRQLYTGKTSRTL